MNNNNRGIAKKNTYRFKAKLMVFFSVVCAAFATILIFLTFGNQDSPFLLDLVLILIFISIIAFIGFIFWRMVYSPVSQIEDILKTLFKRKAYGQLEELTVSTPEKKNQYNMDRIMRELQDLIKSEYSAEIMRNQAELNALQSQINPHFLYNTLESIRGLAIVYKVKDIEIMTKALADMFRYIISKKSSIISFREELINVDNYLKIQQFRFNNKFIIQKEIDEDTLDNQIPKLLIQPIVENALQHGLEKKRTKGKIAITAYNTEDKFIVNIKDDGLGMNIDKLRELNEALATSKPLEGKKSGSEGSIGLLNVNERIKMTFGEYYGMRIYSAEDVGTNVEIVMKTIRKKENGS